VVGNLVVGGGKGRRRKADEANQSGVKGLLGGLNLPGLG